MDSQAAVEAIGVVEPGPAPHGQPWHAPHLPIMDPGPVAPPVVWWKLSEN